MASPTHILIVDDEPGVRRLLRKLLETEEFEISCAANGSEMWKCLGTGTVDLITLDLNLKDEDGLELAREIRSQRNIPIIMITGRTDPIDRALGLEAGADDYIIKPFHVREVLARIKLVMGRYKHPIEPLPSGSKSESISNTYVFNGLIADIKRRELRNHDGTRRLLTAAEFELLCLFLRNPNRVLSRDELFRALYDQDWSPDDRRVDSLVSRLRSRIEASGNAQQFVKSVRGVGYIFTGKVSYSGGYESAEQPTDGAHRDGSRVR